MTEFVLVASSISPIPMNPRKDLASWVASSRDSGGHPAAPPKALLPPPPPPLAVAGRSLRVKPSDSRWRRAHTRPCQIQICFSSVLTGTHPPYTSSMSAPTTTYLRALHAVVLDLLHAVFVVLHNPSSHHARRRCRPVRQQPRLASVHPRVAYTMLGLCWSPLWRAGLFAVTIQHMLGSLSVVASMHAHHPALALG